MKVETDSKLKDMQEQYADRTEIQREDNLHKTPITPDDMAEKKDNEELVENHTSVVLKSTCEHDVEADNTTSEDKKQRLQEGQEKQRLQEGQEKQRHNIIRRRKHYNVNNLIKELASLLPNTNEYDTTVNDEYILTAAVKYVKHLQKDEKCLQTLETCRSSMESLNKTMHIRIVQLELKLQLYKLFSNRTLTNTLEE